MAILISFIYGFPILLSGDPMKIKDLQPRQGKVEIVATVIEKKEPRDIATANFSGKVCDAKLKDDSGTIKFSLWNEQVEQVGIGDTVKISNGYVSEYQGEMQLSTGKFGKLEIVTKAEAVEEEKGQKQTEIKKNFDDSDFQENLENTEDSGSEEEFVE